MKMSPEDAAAWLETKKGSAASATWFWSVNSLNWSADIWNIDAITRRINGGLNSADQRRKLCEAALDALRDLPTE
jgi:putative chitinase